MILPLGRKNGRPSAIMLGDRARDAGDWHAAARHYRTALERNPARAPIWVQYGHALKESGFLAQAEAAYRRALAEAPKVADTYLQLGHVLKLQGRAKEAEAAYLRALVLHPALPDVPEELRGLGWSEAMVGELAVVANPDAARPTKRVDASRAEPVNAPPAAEVPRGEARPQPSGPDMRALATVVRDSGLFDPQVYLSLPRQADLRQGNADPTKHFIEYGFQEGRPFTNPEVIARRLARFDDELRRESARFREEAEALAARPGYPDITGRRPGKLRIGIFCSSEGNFFMREFAELLAWGLHEAGIEAVHRDETADRSEAFHLRVFVAPHEFFYLGAGPAWAPVAAAANSVLYNVEQMQTQWFCRALPLLMQAPLVLDANFHNAVLLRTLGCNALHFMPGYLPDTPYTKPCIDISDIELMRGYAFAREPFDWQQRHSLEDRPIDILFIGSSAPRRDTTLARLASLTDRYRFVCVYTHQDAPLTPHTYRSTSTAINCALAQRSKIVLNIHRDWLGYFEWSRMVLQGFWQGACVVSDPSLPNPLFQPGIHYLEENCRHLGELIRWLLSSDDGRRKLSEIAHAGFKQASSLGRMAVTLAPALSAFHRLTRDTQPALFDWI